MNIKKPSPTPQSHPSNHPHHDQQDDNPYELTHNPKQLQGFNQLPVQQSQDSEQGDILQKIDSLLQQNSNNQSCENQNGGSNRASQKEMLLNFKINQMQKIIQNLNQANKKLNRRLEDYYTNEQQHQGQTNTNRNYQGNKNNDSSNMLNSSSQSNMGFNDELTQMQGDFQEIQSLLKDYKDQLVNSERKWNAIKQEKDQEIESLKNQLITISSSREIMENELNQFSQENELLKNKNQQLIMQIQSLEQQLQRRSQYSQQQQYSVPATTRYSNYYQTPIKKYQAMEDYRFNQKIQRQMETMIKKLLKQLSHQRKVNSKINLQLKRLNNQLIQAQKKIKHKNDTIYHLQMKIIHIQKTYGLNLPTFNLLSYPGGPNNSATAFNSHINNNMNHIYTHHQNNPAMTFNSNTPSQLVYNSNPNAYNPPNTKRYTPINLSNPNSSLKYSPTMNKALHLTPSDRAKNQSIYYQANYQPKSSSPKYNKHEPQILMKQYSAQYTEYEDFHQGNTYEDYGPPVTIPLQSNKGPLKGKSQHLPGTNSPPMMQKAQSQQNNPRNTPNSNQLAFVKPKKSYSNQQPSKKQLQQQQQQVNVNVNPNQNINIIQKSSTSTSHQHQYQQQQSISQSQPKQFLSFTLMQLHQGRFKITMKQKIIIISRLIELYCKKIKNRNYYNLIAQEIQVYNFNQKHPNLIRIRIVDAHSNTSKGDISSTLQDDTEESLMYNLAFIVQNLVKEVETIDQRDLEVDLNLGQIIEDILTKSQQQKVAYFQELSKSLENSVTTLQ